MPRPARFEYPFPDVPEPSRPRLTYRDLFAPGREVVYLLDFVYGGRVYHLAEQDEVAPIGENAADVVYEAGLEWGGAVRDTIKLFTDEDEGKSVDLTLHIDDVAERVSMGHNPGAGYGRFRAWVRGTSAVLTLVEGRFRDPSWDESPAALVGTLEEVPALDEAQWPGYGEKVDGRSHTNVDPAINGERYVYVFGSPGKSGLQMQATPVLFVDTVNDLFQVAGHHVGATQVRIINASDWTADNATIVNTEDGRNHPIAQVDMTGLAMTINAGDSYFCRWLTGAGAASYGLMERGAPLRAAGDVLMWWARQSSLRWDWGRLAAARPLLNRFVLDGYAQAKPDERFSPFAWLQDNLLPLLPVSMRVGPHGVYPVVWSYFLEETAATAHLVEGGNCDRASAVEYTSLDDVYGTVEVYYTYDAEADERVEMVGLTGDMSLINIHPLDTPDHDPNVFLRRGFAQYAREDTLVVETNIIQDDATAGRIAAWLARRHAAQFLECIYEVDPEVAYTLTPGDVVKLTDVGRYFSARVGIVQSVEWSGTGQFAAVTLHLPMMDLHTAG